MIYTAGGKGYKGKEAIDKHRLTGTVKLFGSPAEEQLVSRSFFVRDGHFKGVDAALHVHIGNELSAGIAAATPIAHKGEVTGAKVLAGSMIDLMLEPGHLVRAKQWFDRGLAEAGIVYAPLLPTETKPPLNLNREEMAKYRGRLKFYLNAPIRFK
jgi:hypothetical protein